jgi:hypothetical protein
MANPPLEGDSPTATTPGLTGKNTAVGSGDGVFGQGFNGVHGEASSSGSGVWGHNTALGSGVFGQGFPGVHGEANFSGGVSGGGVWGHNSGPGYGAGGQCDQGDGVFGQGHNGVHGTSNDPTLTGVGVLGEHPSVGMGVKGTSVSAVGVFGQGQNGVHGVSNDPTLRGIGVLGEHPSAGVGVKGTSVSGAGVEAISESGAGINAVSTTGAGVSAISSAGTGVQGISRPPVLLPGPITGDGVVGIGKNGVHGESSSPTDSGVWGDNLSSGYGVSGSSTHGNGVIGLAAGARADGGTGNGVIGRTTSGSATASGVWGENTGSGYGVGGKSAGASGVWGENTGSGYGVEGRSARGQGVHGESGSDVGVYGQGGFNGVHGVTANSSASGVWGENTGAGYGVGGQSTSGIGVYGKGTPAGQFDGDVIINGGNLTMNRGDIRLPGADCAEQFDIAGARQLDPGTVAVIDEDGALRESREAYDRKVAGVVSGAGAYKPGIVLGGASREDRALVAVVGKVYCKVDARHGPIELGDLLTTSPTPGHAMRASDPVRAFGAVIGKALRPMSDGCGLLPMLVALQ